MVYLVTHRLKESYKSCTQWLTATGALLLMVQTGIMGGWTSPNITRLTSENSTIPITLTEASWVASCLNLGRFLGVTILPFLMELLGSKKTVLFTFFPLLVSWLLMIFVNSVEGLYAARLTGGISFGLAYGSFSLFLGEVALPKYRGTLITFAMIGAPLGSVLGTLGETYLTMKISSSIYLAGCLISIALFFWLPDSPYNLVKNKRMDEAEKSIKWYRGTSDVEKEISDIRSFVECNADQKLVDKLREFKTPPIRKALILVIVVFSFSQLCGLFNILFYMEVILIKGKSFLIDPKQIVIYANLMCVLAALIAIKLIDRFGRRILLITSSAGVTLSLTGLGLHFYLLNRNFDPEPLQWLPVTACFLFTFGFSIGFMIVPGTILSEMFPSSVKSIAATVTSLTSAVFGFLSSKSYQPMVDAIGEAYVFWIHAGFAVLAIPCALFYMPETKGKTFQQIQDDLRKK